MAEDRNPQGDEQIERTERAEEERGGGRDMQAANLFDLRRIIGGLFSLYGVVLIIMGLNESSAEIAKSAGVHINLWAGIGMLVMGLLFLLWAFTRPLGRQLAQAEAESEQPRGRPGDDTDGARRADDAGRQQSEH
jgi:hypothetical protein